VGKNEHFRQEGEMIAMKKRHLKVSPSNYKVTKSMKSLMVLAKGGKTLYSLSKLANTGGSLRAATFPLVIRHYSI
jgi:hypothetical protein